MVLHVDPPESFFTNFLHAAGDALCSLHSALPPATIDLASKNIEFVTKSYDDEPIRKAVLVAAEERKSRSRSFEFSVKSSCDVQKSDSSMRAARVEEREASCSNCSHFAAARSSLADNFVQTFQSPFNSGKKQSRKHTKIPSLKEGDVLPLELFPFHPFHDLGRTALQLFDHDFLVIIDGIIKGRKADFDGFLSNMKFARVGGAVPSLMGVASSGKDGREDCGSCSQGEPIPQKIADVLLSISVASIKRFSSTLSAVSMTELIEFIPQLGQPSKEYPDKKKLFSVQDFFRYSESEGNKFFKELDRDRDGQVTLEDLEIAMKKRRLPRRYAREFLHRTRRHLFCKSIGWKQFLSLMEQKEPVILRAYTTLCLSKSGTLQKNQILTSLRSAGLPANEENAVAMIRYLNADSRGPISYSHFRNFMLLLPSERLEDDPRNIWFEAATVVSVSPPVEIAVGSVLKSALAGGLACALSTSVMHPVDTMKTRVQASTLSFPQLVSRLPQIGIRGLYRGSIPAILGQFSSHGLRTGVFEATKLILISVTPTLPEIQVQSMASFCSSILGTAIRIPCEVLKQRLQAGIFDNVGEAIVGTLCQNGMKGFFRGTGATLLREVPFYVAGMGLYGEAKKGAQKLLRRELTPWETIAMGALSGGLAAVVTTPFDVMKTRMMTAPQGLPVSMQMVAFTILCQEGPIGLFKGAVPRFFWIAPLGAMNFAGYELAKKAMDKNIPEAAEHPCEKKKSSSTNQLMPCLEHEHPAGEPG